LPEMEEFVQWLNSQYPKEVAKIEVERVSFEESFDGGSTLMLLSMPISVRAHLDGSYGSSLAGFVKSRNLLADKSKLRMTQLEMEMTKLVNMMREEREKAREEREKAREAREKEEEEAREKEKKKGEEVQSEMAKMVIGMREERDKAREKEEEAREKEKKKKERTLSQRWRKWAWRSENEGE
jgi:hypothetical protein